MMATFGQRIRELRHAKGLTLRDLARDVDRDFTYLSKIENARCLPPSAELIVALAARLDGDPEELAILGDKPPVAVLRQQLARWRDGIKLLGLASPADRLAWLNEHGPVPGRDTPTDDHWRRMIACRLLDTD